MINVSLLNRVVDEYFSRTKKPRTALAWVIGMSLPTYYSRIRGESEWKASEIVAFVQETGIGEKTRDKIFCPVSE